MRRALPRLVPALGALVVAWLVAVSVPDVTPWYGGDCGAVRDWASNQDSSCNSPLLDRAVIVVALVALAVVLVLDIVVKAEASRSVRAVNLATWTLSPVLAFGVVNEMFDDAGWPNTVTALITLALTIAVLGVIPVSAADQRATRVAVLAVGLAGSAALFGYAQMLWGGNGT